MPPIFNVVYVCIYIYIEWIGCHRFCRHETKEGLVVQGGDTRGGRRVGIGWRRTEGGSLVSPNFYFPFVSTFLVTCSNLLTMRRRFEEYRLSGCSRTDLRFPRNVESTVNLQVLGVTCDGERFSVTGSRYLEKEKMKRERLREMRRERDHWSRRYRK